MEVRITLPVTLNDENINMRSTINSPDAEKLCPFTAVEIKKLEDEGHSPLNDISIAMDNTEVIFFVKYYDKMINGEMVPRYVILKTYTTDETKAFTQNTASASGTTIDLDSAAGGTVSDDVTLISTASNKEGGLETQFLTPTTKNALEEVAQQCGPAECTTSQPCNAKRTINFGTITPEDLENVASQLPDSDADKLVQTPKKKNKREDKQVYSVVWLDWHMNTF